MNEYDPYDAPDPQAWTSLSEDEQSHLVRRYHDREGDLPPDANLDAHVLCHVTVESQAALGDETPVADALDRLTDEGLDRHQAVHAVASVFMEHLWSRQKAQAEGGLSPGESVFSEEEYFDAVRTLTAQQWLDQAPKF